MPLGDGAPLAVTLCVTLGDAVAATLVNRPVEAVTAPTAEPLKPPTPQVPESGPVSVPLIVQPAKAQSLEACPVSAAAMVPAEKLPLLSRATMVEAVFELVASVPIVAGAEPL